MTREEFNLEVKRLILEEKLTLDEIKNELEVSLQKVISAVSYLKTHNIIDKNYCIKKDANIGIIASSENEADSKEHYNIKSSEEIIVDEFLNKENISEEVINDFLREKTIEDVIEVNNKRKIEVVKVNFEKPELITYEELFDGFEELYAITYSSSPDFIYNLSKKFKYMEIIFGSSNVINGTVANLFAAQMYSIDLLKKSKYQNELVKRINEETLFVYLPKDKISHEKIYILKGNNKTRVIIGSANMSNCAFNGIQRENISYMDELEAYRYYKETFENLKLNSTNELDISTIDVTNDTKVEETPLYGIIKEKEFVYITNSESSEDFELTTAIENLSKNLKEYLPEPKKIKNLEKKKLTFDDLQKATIKRSSLIEEEKERRKEYPKFRINLNSGDISLNNVDFKAYVENSFKDFSIKKDIQFINKFVKGFDSFVGDKEHSKDAFWKLLVYCFASPVLTACRKKNNGYSFTNFPMYGIIYGDSNAAKTTMVNFVQKLMFGMNFPDQENDSFTPTRLFGLKSEIEGVPIVINDLSGDNWSRYAGKILKSDSWEIQKKNNSPATIITTNDISSIKSELSRRCILLNVSAKIGREESMKNAKAINDILEGVSPKFYLEYLEHFIPKLNKMLEDMEYGKDPDIFEISSLSLIEVIENHFDGKKPKYAKLLKRTDFFGENIIGYNALNKIKEEYISNKNSFNIDKKRNIVEITFEKGYLAQRIANELPVKMEAKVIGSKLVLNLEETQESTKINFSKNKIINNEYSKEKRYGFKKDFIFEKFNKNKNKYK